MSASSSKATPPVVSAAAGENDLTLSPAEDRVVRKVLRYVIPLAVVGLFFSFIDRTNIAVAGPAMEESLGLTPKMFGLASGLFFIGYVFFEIPSNLALKRFGARLWLARIMVSWGAICVAMSFVQGATSLYAMRFLLGVAEAGFYPGVLFYLSLFVPARQLTKAYSLFQIGIPVSLAVGSVLTSALLTMHGFMGLDGWQWVFIVEGGATILIGLVFLLAMSSTPAQARWLTADEKQTLARAIARDRDTDDDGAHGGRAVLEILRNPQVWYYCVVYTFMMLGFYSVTYWLPQIIKLKFSLGTVESGLLSAVPWAIATFALVAVSRYTSRHGRRALVLTIVLFWCAVGMLLSSLANFGVIAFIGLCMGACIQAAVPLLYSFPSQHFPGARGAVALALVNSIGNIGGFFGPYLLGWLREGTGTDTIGLLLLSLSFVAAGTLSLGLTRQLRRSPAYVEGIE